MDIRITPAALNGRLAAITSKSDAHRALICAALCDGVTDVIIHDVNRDINATADCLSALGAVITHPTEEIFRVEGIKSVPESPLLDCGESGSTLRFMLPVAAAVAQNASVTGSGRLPERPLSPLMEEMEQKGCSFSNRQLPLTLSGGLKPGVYTLPGNVSSQYVTGLLLALPFMDGDSEIILTSKLESIGYVNMTLRTLSKFGVSVEELPNGGGYRVKGGQRCVSPGTITAEGDWSNAAFWVAAAAMGGEIELFGIDMQSLQGDKAILDLASQFGANVIKSDDEVKISAAPMSGIEIDAGNIPDIVPELALMACAAKGDTVIKNAARLRIKESDRLSTVAQMITSFGGDIEELADGLIIHGTGSLKGGITDSFNDHRIAMAAAIASVICKEDVIITNAQAVEKSYPKFFEHFNKLGGKADVIEHG